MPVRRTMSGKNPVGLVTFKSYRTKCLVDFFTWFRQQDLEMKSCFPQPITFPVAINIELQFYSVLQGWVWSGNFWK